MKTTKINGHRVDMDHDGDLLFGFGGFWGRDDNDYIATNKASKKYPGAGWIIVHFDRRTGNGRPTGKRYETAGDAFIARMKGGKKAAKAVNDWITQ